MTKDVILVGSGFVIPNNRLFNIVTKDSSYRSSILGNKNRTGVNTVLSDLIETGTLNSSDTCNELYTSYIHKQTVDTYLDMVDAVAEIFKNISIKDFIVLQSRNRYLSPLGYQLCKDLVNGRLNTTYNKYLVSSSFFQLSNPVNLKDDDLSVRVSDAERMFGRDSYVGNFIDIIAGLVSNKQAFSAFFKFILTDSNRGGVYG